MPRWLFPLLTLLVVVLSAVLVWAWSTDAVLKAKCAKAGGSWEPETRTCALVVSPSRP